MLSMLNNNNNLPGHIPSFIVPGLLVNIIDLFKHRKSRILHSIKIIIIKTLYNVCYTALLRGSGNLPERLGNTGFVSDILEIYDNYTECYRLIMHLG